MTGRELAARALLAGSDGAPQRVGNLLEVDPQLLEGVRMCLAAPARRVVTR